MEWNGMYKIVYEDQGITKVIHGTILKEDDFLLYLKTKTNEEVTIGKRAIIKISMGVDYNE